MEILGFVAGVEGVLLLVFVVLLKRNEDRLEKAQDLLRETALEMLRKSGVNVRVPVAPADAQKPLSERLENFLAMIESEIAQEELRAFAMQQMEAGVPEPDIFRLVTESAAVPV
jgi:hypothetical protein